MLKELFKKEMLLIHIASSVLLDTEKNRMKIGDMIYLEMLLNSIRIDSSQII
jgi:hypothetical protein